MEEDKKSTLKPNSLSPSPPNFKHSKKTIKKTKKVVGTLLINLSQVRRNIKVKEYPHLKKPESILPNWEIKVWFYKEKFIPKMENS